MSLHFHESWFLLFLCFVATACLFAGIAFLAFGKKRKLSARIQKYTNSTVKEITPTSEMPESPQQPLGARLLSSAGKRFEGKHFVMKWEKRLEEAAVPFRPEEFFVLRLGSGLAFVTLSFLFGLAFSKWVLLLMFGLGYWILSPYLTYRKNKRLSRCSMQLPSVLGTMATAMRAGFSFLQALKLVGQEAADPLGPEFNRTLRELSLGLPMEEGLNRMLERLPDPDLELVVTALLIQRSTGGNLAEILDSMQETIQERVKIKEELKALTAQGRLSAIIITLLPFVLGLALSAINPEYFMPMFHHPLGWFLIGAGACSGLMGWLFIRKIVRIEV